MLEVLCHRVKFGEARISPAAGAVKNVEFFVLVRPSGRGTVHSRPHKIFLHFHEY